MSISKQPLISASPSGLRIYFVPLPSPGHVIPMIDIAKIFTKHGAECTLIMTPLNAARYESNIHRSGLHLVTFQFPSDTGLPVGCESADLLPSRKLFGHFRRVVDLLEQPFRELLRVNPPDAVVSDSFLLWTAVASAELNIPRYSFPVVSCFALSVERNLLFHRPQQNVTSDLDLFLVPGLPDQIYLTKCQLSETTLPDEKLIEFFERALEAEKATTGWVVNTFYELESPYIKHCERVTGKPVFHIGPVCLSGVSKEEIAERGHGKELAAVSERLLRWLDGRPAFSVVYVSFGSVSWLPKAQLKEIGFGLVESGVPFIWVVGGGDESDDVADEVSAIAGDAGQVVKGWAPQLAILGHISVGTFLTHCGWGAVTEATAVGKMMLTWPLFADQFYNEKFVVQVAEIGESMGAERGYIWGEEERTGVLLNRERVAEKVRWSLGPGAESMRKRAWEIGIEARKGGGKGGSSYESVECMMEDIRKHRGQRTEAGVHGETGDQH
ncbi:scopoletin glucosyltransferase-like protein [Carex littledalei]|uniref:Scopoletin glucosyltransferase-like protein n=1 Tax=Carex littledalei TaxID=544730 RepID=A0A833VMK6_9POAL|nr:scopoletin glucosyltransferase-like protein [Carex littledalei]